jgi:hypothetical protein
MSEREIIGFNEEQMKIIQAYRRDEARYKQKIAELEAANRWIPVSERLPKERQTVIASAYYRNGWEIWKGDPDTIDLGNNNCNVSLPAEYKKNAWYLEDDEEIGGVVTHWRPLPKPPTA